MPFTVERHLVLALAVAPFLGCPHSDALHDRGDYAALSSEKTWAVVDACTRRRGRLDGAAAQAFLGTDVDQDCANAAAAEAARTAEAMIHLAERMKTASDKSELQSLVADGNARGKRWDAVMRAGPEWVPTIVPILRPAIQQITDAQNARALALAVGSMQVPRKDTQHTSHGWGRTDLDE